jgi:2,4-dichlorophenol 6-monooxygenase
MLESIGELGLGGSRGEFMALVESAEGRARIARIIDAQREHFDMVGLQLGFRYDAGAVVSNDGEAVEPAPSVSAFVPSGRAGCRMPHAWLDAARRRSSLDLLAGDVFTVLAGPDAAAWSGAARERGAGVRLLVAGRDFDDAGGGWRDVCGIASDGALLLRPDQHVAWRAPTAAFAARGALADVLTALLLRRPAGSRTA